MMEHRLEHSVHRENQHVSYRLSRKGWGFLLGSLLAVLVAYQFGHPMLYLLSSALMAILACNALFQWGNLRGLRLGFGPQPPWFCGSPTDLPVELDARQSHLSSRDVEVEACLEDGSWVSRRRAGIARGSRCLQMLPVTPARRGRLELLGVRCRSSYPFGLVEKRVERKRVTTVLVFPRLLETGVARRGIGRRSGGRLPEMSGDVQYLDVYRPGEDVRFIHWRKSVFSEDPVIRRDVRKRAETRRWLFVPDQGPHVELGISVMATRIWLGPECLVGLLTPEGPRWSQERQVVMALLALCEPSPFEGRESLMQHISDAHGILLASELALEYMESAQT